MTERRRKNLRTYRKLLEGVGHCPLDEQSVIQVRVRKKAKTSFDAATERGSAGVGGDGRTEEDRTQLAWVQAQGEDLLRIERSGSERKLKGMAIESFFVVARRRGLEYAAALRSVGERALIPRTALSPVCSINRLSASYCFSAERTSTTGTRST